jgi:cell division septum initiation protein DivIVA
VPKNIFDNFDDDDNRGNSFGTEVIPVELGDTESFLNEAIDAISSAPNAPLSSAPKINREQILGILQEALDCLPAEITEARWMLKERADFLAKTQLEADEILEAARVQAERLVQRTAIVRQSEARARKVIEAANQDSRRLKSETDDFLDRRLGSFEILLDKLVKQVSEGRTRLSLVAQEPAREISLESESVMLFDQDDEL